MIDIAELERLLGAATPGEWQAFIGSEAPQPIYPGVVCFACSPETKAYVVVEDGFVREHEANARLVAALHESAPALLAELKAAREEIDVKAERIAGLQRVIADAPCEEQCSSTPPPNSRGCDCWKARVPAALASRGVKHGEEK